jgi:hypothetical protein
VRKRRKLDQGFSGRLGAAGGALALRMWAGTTRHPVDSFAIVLAAAVSLVIIVNAVFLQSGSHPAPFLANTKPAPIAASADWRPGISAPVRPGVTAVTPQPIAARRDDPIADLIWPSPRIAAVQRALSDYGYGQITPSGTLDNSTTAAIEKFEREHRLPVTGEVSDRLMHELAALVGHPLQ